VSRSLKYDIPGPDRRITLDQVREKGLAALFAPDVPEPLPLVVEFGFGRGEFLRDLAAAAPDVAHLGVELSFKRVLKMARRIAKAGDPNIRLIEGRGQDALRELPDASIRCLWINFSDPWPKKRHHERRMIQPPLIERIATRLVPGGRLEIATDHVGYAEHIDAVLREAGAKRLLRNRMAPVPFARDMPGRRHTAYESEWRAEGRALHFWSYERRASKPEQT